ncbi:hypothetical protein BHYA_0039g00050 [Botrytis hyacinthi]|uniref:Uncharacterized protein n=1 Tax=Botrytis hyacinthi TaxID=278943 RepID=A0A4Z1GTZ2_9HELO|nr:hypothetical protein BHYA_0039g00050 [Botrytis hyacinthi]
MERTTMPCNPEYSFEASRNSYYDEEEQQGDYNDPIQTDCNNYRHCFESYDHLYRYKSFQKFIEPFFQVLYTLEHEERDLGREHHRVNQLYTSSLNEFTGSSIKFLLPKRRDLIHSDCRPLNPFSRCVCCVCFLELVAHYLQSVIVMKFRQKHLDILKAEHQELVEKTLSLRWKIDNNQVHADELADMLNAEDRKGDTGTRWEKTMQRTLYLSLIQTTSCIITGDNDLEASPRTGKPGFPLLALVLVFYE